MTRARDVANSTTALSVDGTVKLDGNYPVGTNNVALGDNAGDAMASGGIGNTAIGSVALTDNTTGDNNTAVGYAALYVNSTGSENTAIGTEALQQSTTGSNGTAVGSAALYANTTGAYNVAIGRSALESNTTADNNTAVGYQAGYSNTTGVVNSAFGLQALYSNTTANNNSAFGALSLYSNTTGSENTAVGREALQANTTGYENTFIGYQSGDTITTGVQNTGIGYKAGGAATTGASNTYLGHGSGSAITTGNQNTILGRFSGNGGGLDIRTSNNQIVLSDGTGNPRIRVDSTGNAYINTTNDMGGILNVSRQDGIAIGNADDQTYYRRLYGAGTGANMELRFWNGSNEGVLNSSGSWVNASDVSLKENIVDTSYGLASVLALQPRDYTMKQGGNSEVGFVAQEMETVVPEVVNTSTNPDGIEIKGIAYGQLTAVLTKAIQEQQATITALTDRITALEGA